MKPSCPGSVILRSFLVVCALLIFVLPAAAGEIVLFDEAHGQRFTAGGSGDLDLSKLAGLIEKAGGDVRPLKERIGPKTLEGVKALVVSGPFLPFAAEEVAAVREFLHNGGRLAVMLHIGPPANSLLEGVHVISSRGVVNESEGVIGSKATDFRLTRLEKHPLTEGLDEFNAYGSWALRNTGPEGWVIARTGPRAWMDVNRSRSFDRGEPVESFGIVVAGEYTTGAFLIFADDAIFQNRFLEGGNLKLAGNLASWLVK